MMKSITGAYVSKKNLFTKNYSTGSWAEDVYDFGDLRGGELRPEVTEEQIKKELAPGGSLLENTLDELVVKTEEGKLALISGRGINPEIQVGDLFISEEYTGRVIASDLQESTRFDQMKKRHRRTQFAAAGIGGPSLLAPMILGPLPAIGNALIFAIFGSVVALSETRIEHRDFFNTPRSEQGYEPFVVGDA